MDEDGSGCSGWIRECQNGLHFALYNTAGVLHYTDGMKWVRLDHSVSGWVRMVQVQLEWVGMDQNVLDGHRRNQNGFDRCDVSEWVGVFWGA